MTEMSTELLPPRRRAASFTLHLHIDAALNAFLTRLKKEGHYKSKAEVAASILSMVMEDDAREEEDHGAFELAPTVHVEGP